MTRRTSRDAGRHLEEFDEVLRGEAAGERFAGRWQEGETRAGAPGRDADGRREGDRPLAGPGGAGRGSGNVPEPQGGSQGRNLSGHLEIRGSGSATIRRAKSRAAWMAVFTVQWLNQSATDNLHTDCRIPAPGPWMLLSSACQHAGGLAGLQPPRHSRQTTGQLPAGIAILLLGQRLVQQPRGFQQRAASAGSSRPATAARPAANCPATCGILLLGQRLVQQPGSLGGLQPPRHRRQASGQMPWEVP